MSRSLSWINGQELNSLFSQMGFTEQAPGSSPQAEAPPPTDEAAEHNNPFDSRAKVLRAQKQAGASASFSPPRPAVPPIAAQASPVTKPMAAIGPLLEARARWEEQQLLPIPQTALHFPECIDAFLAWLLITTEAESGFLADDQGLPLATNTEDSVAALSSTFSLTSQLMHIWDKGALQQLILPIQDAHTWHLGWVDTNRGRIAWGIATNALLSLEQTRCISLLLEAVLNRSAIG